jgi:ribonuclease P/MRP protein subunit POP1
MDSVRKKGRPKPKRGKVKHVSRTESLLKRQRLRSFSCTLDFLLIFPIGDKMWLETHVWHAKRMHMKKIWGYSLVCLSCMQQ